MERNELEQKAINVIADKLDMSSDQIKFENELVDELGVDSLDKLNIVMGIEDEFDIEIYDTDMDDIKTVKDLCDLVEGKLNRE